MNELRELIPESVLRKAEVTVSARPINEASNFFDFKETDEVTGRSYWFCLNSKENIPKIELASEGFTERYFHSSNPSQSWRGEKIGIIELVGLEFVAFKVFPITRRSD